MSKTERLVVEINIELKKRFQEKVEKEGRSMTWYINRWVKDYTYDKKEIK
ncbi:MAG TPA: hypothetical protein VLA13_10025 [Massilibacterium sp.]|nr:hypothetical protein [Massilibacterium sp.]